MAIINDFKAIRERCEEISDHMLGPKFCSMCHNLGWILIPDVRIGFPDIPTQCMTCSNASGKPNPWPEISREHDQMEDRLQNTISVKSLKHRPF